jgi:hypothetical protein
MYLHSCIITRPPVHRQPTGNPPFYIVADPKTGVTAVSGDRIMSLSRDTMVKKRAFLNTAKEEIITSRKARILPIVRIIGDLFLAADILPQIPCSPIHLFGKRSSFRDYFTCPGDEVTKKGGVEGYDIPHSSVVHAFVNGKIPLFSEDSLKPGNHPCQECPAYMFILPRKYMPV